MAGLVELGLHAGAFGLSTGLEYDPGSRADLGELAAIAGPVAAHDAIVVSHMRTEDAGRVDAALDELISSTPWLKLPPPNSPLPTIVMLPPASITITLPSGA